MEINKLIDLNKLKFDKFYNHLLQEKLDTFLKFNGLISSKVQGANKRLSELSEKQANLEDRIAKLYSRYETQYSAMESTIAGLNETSSLLENAFKWDRKYFLQEAIFENRKMSPHRYHSVILREA